MKSYHICAMHQLPDCSIQYYDSTFNSDIDLSEDDRYDELKQTIADIMEPPVQDGSSLIVLSLTQI